VTIMLIRHGPFVVCHASHIWAVFDEPAAGGVCRAISLHQREAEQAAMYWHFFGCTSLGVATNSDTITTAQIPPLTFDKLVSPYRRPPSITSGLRTTASRVRR
jgi:hypothetical protein